MTLKLHYLKFGKLETLLECATVHNMWMNICNMDCASDPFFKRMNLMITSMLTVFKANRFKTLSDLMPPTIKLLFQALQRHSQQHMDTIF